MGKVRYINAAIKIAFGEHQSCRSLLHLGVDKLLDILQPPHILLENAKALNVHIRHQR